MVEEFSWQNITTTTFLDFQVDSVSHVNVLFCDYSVGCCFPNFKYCIFPFMEKYNVLLDLTSSNDCAAEDWELVTNVERNLEKILWFKSVRCKDSIVRAAEGCLMRKVNFYDTQSAFFVVDEERSHLKGSCLQSFKAISCQSFNFLLISAGCQCNLVRLSRNDDLYLVGKSLWWYFQNWYFLTEMTTVIYLAQESIEMRTIHQAVPNSNKNFMQFISNLRDNRQNGNCFLRTPNTFLLCVV